MVRRVYRHLRRVRPSFAAASTAFLATLALTSFQLPADEPAPASPPAAAASPAPSASPGSTGVAPAFEPPALPAAGRGRSLLKVSRPGRYALSVKSDSGTAIQLVDRMGGPGEVAGRPGEEDGRIDVYLEPGEYLLRSEGAKGSKGEAALSVTPFRELVDGELQLPRLREIAAELGDLEERSYWFEVDKSANVVIEAAGRHLADVSLWRDGGWRVAAEPKVSEIEPRPGRPLRLVQLETLLAPGLYRLSLAGGQGLPWADDDGSRPVALRRGLEVAGEAGRGRHTLGLFGFARFLVPSSANYLRLELPGRGLPAGNRLAIDYVAWREGATFQDSEGWLELTKETEPPLLEGYLDAEADGYRLVTITGTTGETFVFQHFNNERVRTFDKHGKYWLATLREGAAADHLDATAVLTSRTGGWSAKPVPLTAVAADVTALGPGVERRRKVSLTGASELFFSVSALGEYEFAMPKTALRVLPLAPTWTYSAPSAPYGAAEITVPFKEGGGRYQLDPGFYVLQLEPREQDVVELTLRSLDKGPRQPVLAAARGMAVLGAQTLAAGPEHTVYINAEADVETGLILRELPIDPRQPLPLEAAGKPVEVPITVAERGQLRAIAEDGTQLALAVGGQTHPGGVWLDPGLYTVGVARQDGAAEPVMASLSFAAAAQVVEEPLTALPLAAITKVPILPQLDDKSERFFDLERGGVRTFLVHAEEPALYRLESSGLLDTEGALRTSLRPRLDASQDGGSGRNFLLQQFLRPGDYQLSVRALGQSAGHLGVKLSRSPVRDGGVLLPGVPARSDLPAGEAVAYRLQVPQAGLYRVRALGLGRPFRIRLEDAAGWPLPVPGVPGDLSLELERGEYRLIVLPQAVDGRVLTRFDAGVAEQGGRQGHGPFPLPLGVTVGHRWLEPTEGEERRPDVWTFSLPAAADVAVELDAEMRGEIFARGGAKAADVPPARPFRGRLPAGDYELRAVCSRRNNRVDYHLKVEPVQLLAGQSRRITAPASVELSLGEASLVEISSFGQVDVRARLYDGEGREVARFDDRPGDWNFSYTGRLGGAYRLQVDPVSSPGETEIVLRQPRETLAAAASFPLARKLQLAAGVEVLPLELPAGSEVLAVAASAPGNVRLSLEAAGGGQASREVASREGREPRLLAWLAPGVAYRLRVESLAHGEIEVALAGAAMPLGAVSEKSLAAGVKPKAVAGLPADFGILAAAFAEPGCFTLVSGSPEAAASQPGRAVAPLQDGQRVLGAPQGKLLLAASPRAPVKLERWRLGAGEATLFLPEEGLAICGTPAARGEGLRLVRAVALAGQPSLAPGEESFLVQAIGRGSATTLLGPAAEKIALRGEGGAPLRLSSRGFAAPAETALAAGGGEAELAPGGSLAWRLPASPASGGGQRLRLLLDQDLVASLEGGGETRRIFSAEEGPVDVALEGRFERLVVVHPGKAAGRVALELVPAEASPAPAPGRPWESRVARAGQIELVVAGGQAVHVRGARGSRLIGADGGIATGEDLALPAGGGRLLIDGEPGLLWVWLDGAAAGGGLAGLWPAELAAGGRKVALPALAELGEGVEIFDFDFAEPTLLHLRGNGAGVVAAEIGTGTPLQVSAHPEAIAADLYLPQGRGRVAVRAAGGAAGGLVELRSSPVGRAGEGLGPAYLLGPGQSRYVAFTVPSAGQIGWAARAESGVVTGRLLRADGREIAAGGAGLADLEAGEYLLGLSVPAEGRPTRVRAALVGLVPRNDLPPRELIARYAAGDLPLPGELAAEAAAAEAAAAEAAAAEAAAGEGCDGCGENAGAGEGGDEEENGEESGDEGGEEGGGEEGGGR